MNLPPVQPGTAGKGRLVFIDFMRGLAVLWMIETHVVNAFLDASYRQQPLFQWLNLSNGFVAPSFIFCAGAGFWLAAERKAAEYRRFGPGLWIYLRRLLLIICIGYALHLPYYSFRKMLSAAPAALMGFYSIDVLQLIVLASLAALLVLLLVRRATWLAVIFGLLWLGVVLATPWVWRADPFQTMPAPLAMLFARQPAARFPFFPWSGYLFAGAAMTALYRSSLRARRWAKIVIGTAVGLVVAIFLIPGLSISYRSEYEWWLSSSSHVLFRTAGTALLFSLLFLLEEKLKGGTSRVLQLCGQESLFIYVLHLLVVYGSVLHSGLSFLSGGIIGPGIVSSVTMILCGFCYFTARLWHESKQRHPLLSQRVVAGAISLYLVSFLVLP